jgi:hypothetical protein
MNKKLKDSIKQTNFSISNPIPSFFRVPYEEQYETRDFKK